MKSPLSLSLSLSLSLPFFLFLPIPPLPQRFFILIRAFLQLFSRVPPIPARDSAGIREDGLRADPSRSKFVGIPLDKFMAAIFPWRKFQSNSSYGRRPSESASGKMAALLDPLACLLSGSGTTSFVDGA
jgi:hypothetical protein